MPKKQLSLRSVAGRLAPIGAIGVLLVWFMTTGNVVSTQSDSAANQDIARGMYRGVQVAERFDISPPLREMKAYPAKEEPDRSKFEERRNFAAGPIGRQDADEVVQSVTTPFAPLVMPTPLLSFDAVVGCSGCAPPDPVGDVGPNHYVAMSNSQFRIFNKSGTSVFGPVNINTLWAGFGGACETENAGDPVVVYDQLDDRWILTQFTAAGPMYYNCVAVSQTGNPTGSYYRYAFSTGTNFPDYPKYGMWSDALYISTREFAGGTFAGVGAYAVNRAQLIAGNPSAQLISFLIAPGSTAYNVGDGLLPSDIDGSTLPPANSPNYFVGSMDAGGQYGAPQDALNFWKFTANFAVPASSTFTLTHVLPVAAVDTIPAFCSSGGLGRSCIPQPGTAARIDHLGYRQRPTWRLAYRNFGTHQSLVTNQSVEATTTMSGIRWYELRVNGAGTPSIFQQGTYAPGTSDGIHRWMGSIAMDASGNMALGYSASSASVFPGVRYTGRLAGDPLGTLPQGEATIVNGTGSQTGGGSRWGDYTSMNIDSTDDCTFWYVNEYVPTTSAAGWRLRVGSFRFPGCVSGPTPTATNTSTPTATGTFTPTATSTNTFTPTRTNTSTPTRTNTSTPSATSTFTPTPTATNTFTPTHTSTNTATPTNSATNTPTPPPVISGTVTYGNAIGAPATRFVSNVAVNGAGSPPVSDVTGSSGAYALTGFGSGSYTVTPSKPGGPDSSVTSFDAARIAQSAVGTFTLNATQQTVADVSGNGSISSFDAAQVASFVVGGSNSGSSGNWRFVPESRTYSEVENLAGEDYSALLMGEVSGNWTDSAARIENSRGPEREVEIKAPHVETPAGDDTLIPVTIDGVTGKEIISYEFALRYDPTVIQPQTNPVDLAGTLSRGLSVITSTMEPGLLRVAVYGATPLEDNGLLLHLRFTSIGGEGSFSPLQWERILLNEDVTAKPINGLVEISTTGNVSMFSSSQLESDAVGPASNIF